MQTIEIYTNLSDLSPKDIKRCKYLSFGEDGLLLRVLQGRQSMKELRMIREDGIIVAWYCNFYWRWGYNFGFYVAKRYRNRGLGTKMVQMAIDSQLAGTFHGDAAVIRDKIIKLNPHKSLYNA